MIRDLYFDRLKFKVIHFANPHTKQMNCTFNESDHRFNSQANQTRNKTGLVVVSSLKRIKSFCMKWSTLQFRSSYYFKKHLSVKGFKSSLPPFVGVDFDFFKMSRFSN